MSEVMVGAAMATDCAVAVAAEALVLAHSARSSLHTSHVRSEGGGAAGCQGHQA